MRISLIVCKRVLLLCQRIVLGFYGLLLSPLPSQLQQGLGHSLPHAVCVAAAGAAAAATFIVHCCRAAFCEETFCDPNSRMEFFISKGLALERQGSTHMDRTLLLQQAEAVEGAQAATTDTYNSTVQVQRVAVLGLRLTSSPCSSERSAGPTLGIREPAADGRMFICVAVRCCWGACSSCKEQGAVAALSVSLSITSPRMPEYLILLQLRLGTDSNTSQRLHRTVTDYTTADGALFVNVT